MVEIVQYWSKEFVQFFEFGWFCDVGGVEDQFVE